MDEQNDPLVVVSQLRKAYQATGGTMIALEETSFSVAKGEFVSIIGPSGCGKSTLIRMIGDVIEPTSGSVTVDGMTSAEARQKSLFSYVFQKPVLLPWRRIIDNVRLPLEVLPVELKPRRTRDPVELLQMVGLGDFADVYPYELSGGMQQRAALARALTYYPEILLMDEPFGAVDELQRNLLNVELLRIWQDVGVTVFFITHSLTEALFLSNRIILFSARPGKIKHILDVDFGYPRDESIKEAPRFLEMARWLRTELEPEVSFLR